jgi:serine/threonine-protein kinase
MGRVKTDSASPGRRIFVDHRSVGQTPAAVLVKCGVHEIKIGSSGRPSTIDIPCGGEIALGDH